MGSLLFVDDDAVARKRAADQLRARHFTVEEADDGTAALAMVKGRLFDVVVTDLLMPKMDGLELMTTLQEAKYPAEVVVVTAAGTVENAVAALKLGAFDFVVKPYDVDELAIKVQNALERGRLKAENERLQKENTYLRQIESLTKNLESSNEELKKKVSELTTLHHIGMLLHATSHEEDLYQRLMDFIGRTFPVEGTALLLVDGQGRLRGRASTGRQAEAWRDLDVPGEQGMFGEVLSFGEPLVVNDGAADVRFDRTLPTRLGMAIRSLLCVPLRVKQKPLGVLVLVNKLAAPREAGTPRFLQEEIALAGMIAREGALTLENFRLREALTEKVRLEEELRLGKQIQESFFPKQLPRLAGWRWEAESRPARVVGGDFYWAKGFETHVDLAVGDVSGKGVPAALYMAKVMAMLQAESGSGRSPAEVVIAVHARIMEQSLPDVFVTLVYLRAFANGRVECVNAGHPPPLHIRPHGSGLAFQKSGHALGLAAGSLYEGESVSLAGGESLVVFTDGLFEGKNKQGDRLTLPRFQEATAAKWRASSDAAAAVRGLFEEAARFNEGDGQDDMTVLVMEKLA